MAAHLLEPKRDGTGGDFGADVFPAMSERTQYAIPFWRDGHQIDRLPMCLIPDPPRWSASSSRV